MSKCLDADSRVSIQELIAYTLRGNGVSNPKAGPLSWALHNNYLSMIEQFSKSLQNNCKDFDKLKFMRDCGQDE
jgi:hypothetical protein